jgi:hypothetical protein
MTNNDKSLCEYICASFSMALAILLAVGAAGSHDQLIMGIESMTSAWEAVTTKPLWGEY